MADRARCPRTSSRCSRPRRRVRRPATTGRTRSSGTGSGRSPTSTGDGPRISARRGADAHAALPGARRDRRGARGREAILDGEIVAFDEHGRPELPAAAAADGADDRGADPPARRDAGDLRRLRPALARRRLAAAPSRTSDRRELLAELGFDGPHWQAPRHHVGDGDGAVGGGPRARASRGSSPSGSARRTGPGQRSREWLKVRNRRGQELVIGGWMPGEGARGGRVGSLLVGYWDATPEEAERLGRPQRLVYAGGVGTGFTAGDAQAADRAARAAAPRPTRRSSSARTRGSSTRSGPATAAPGRSGSSPSWSARSSSPSGPTRAPCASRRSRACATTRTRARSCASLS